MLLYKVLAHKPFILIFVLHCGQRRTPMQHQMELTCLWVELIRVYAIANGVRAEANANATAGAIKTHIIDVQRI